MKKKIKLSIISTLLLTSTLVITLPIVSCSGSTNPTIPINPPIYTIDATKFDSNKIVKINEVVSAIVNDPNSTTQQKMTRYRNLNTYANNIELLKSVNDYFFLIDKNNNDSVIKNSIESLEIIPTTNPTLTYNQAMPKVTIKINLKPEFRKYMENDNIFSYSFDTGTLDILGLVRLNINFDIPKWKNFWMQQMGTFPGNNFTYQEQLAKIKKFTNYTVSWLNENSSPTFVSDTVPWDFFSTFFSVNTSSGPINQNLGFAAISILGAYTAPLVPRPGEVYPHYTLSFIPRPVGTSTINHNNYSIHWFNLERTWIRPGETFNFEERNFGTLASK